jgi:hypothetical protein
MSKVNWIRLIIGSLIATVIAFFSDGFFHEKVVAADWAAVYTNLGISEPRHNAAGLFYFAIFELGRGFVGMFLYVMMRRHFQAGPKTAVLAGIVMWLAFSVTGPAQFIPLGFFSNTLWLKVAAFQFVTSILAMIAGAVLYKDA